MADRLNQQLAVADSRTAAMLERIQNELFDAGADLSVPFGDDDGRLRIARDAIERLQNELFDLGADLSVPYAAGDGKLRVTQPYVDRLEADCDEANAGLRELTSFVLPGGSEAASRLHVARAVCRRAEREVLEAARARPVNPLAAVYLNRLSDLLFILARVANAGEEPLWTPGG